MKHVSGLKNETEYYNREIVEFNLLFTYEYIDTFARDAAFATLPSITII